MPYCKNCGFQLDKDDHYCEVCGKKRNSSFNENSYIGKICPYCQYPIKQDSEVTVCSACKVPHHRECWEENGGCTTFGHQGYSNEEQVRERSRREV